jgi:GNAT superfamily N-acetyltransferase
MSEFLKLRPVDADDEPFLRALRAQVDVERLGLQGWAPEQVELARSLIDMQFRAHGAHYRQVKANYDTKDCIIELGGVPVGRFIVTQNGKEVLLSDIAVCWEHRGKGLGQAVIEATKAECVQSKRVLRLHVDPLNPVVQFYLSLGFRIVETHPTTYLMEWVPPAVVDKATRYL